MTCGAVHRLIDRLLHDHHIAYISQTDRPSHSVLKRLPTSATIDTIREGKWGAGGWKKGDSTIGSVDRDRVRNGIGCLLRLWQGLAVCSKDGLATSSTKRSCVVRHALPSPPAARHLQSNGLLHQSRIAAQYSVGLRIMRAHVQNGRSHSLIPSVHHPNVSLLKSDP